MYIRRNWKLKLLSLVLAIMLWYTVFEIGEPKKDISITISTSNIARDHVIMKMDPEKAIITVSGRVSLLKDIKDEDIRVSVSLNGAKEGENIFPLNKTAITVPRGIEVEEIKPSTVRVVLDRVIEKKLKTAPRLDKKWAGKYGIVSWSPQQVTVEGPRSIIAKIAAIESVPVNGDLRRNEETVNAELKTEDLSSVKVRPDKIRVILRKQNGKEPLWDLR